MPLKGFQKIEDQGGVVDHRFSVIGEAVAIVLEFGQNKGESEFGIVSTPAFLEKDRFTLFWRCHFKWDTKMPKSGSYKVKTAVYVNLMPYSNPKV